MAQLPSPDEQQQRLLTELATLQLVEKRDFWLVYNGSHWRLSWFDHVSAEQQVRGDTLVNALLNRGQ